MLDWLYAVMATEQARVIGGITAGIIGLGLVATLFALFKYAQVRNWTRASGKILSSQPGFELVQRFQNEPPRNQRVAKIGYEFQANGQIWRSGRILDSGEPAEDQVERLLKDYPAGKTVIVYHHPRDPKQSALEIDHPPELAKGCLAATLILVVCAAIAIWLTTDGITLILATFPDAILPLMIAGVVAGCVFLFVFYLFAKQAAEVRRWPQVTATIVSSGVRSFSVLRDEPRKTFRGKRLRRTGFMPVVEYKYQVGGRDYASRSIFPDTEISGGQAYAQRYASKYPPGSVVMAIYDPAKPQRAALEAGGSFYWLFLLGALIGFGVAAASSGLVF